MDIDHKVGVGDVSHKPIELQCGCIGHTARPVAASYQEIDLPPGVPPALGHKSHPRRQQLHAIVPVLLKMW